jgi:uncharacterized protein involved in exopolysaccharide biosynthesis
MDEKEYVEQEINLREYISIVVKRKKIVLGILLMSIIIATIVTFLTPKIYEVSTVIRLGLITQPLISKPEATQMLMGQTVLYSVNQGLNLNIDVNEFRKSILKIVDIKDTNFLEVKIRYTSPDLAVKICNLVSNAFIQEVKEIYNKSFSLLTNRIQEIEQQVKVAEDRIETLYQKVDTQGSANMLRVMSYNNNIVTYENLYNLLKEKEYTLKNDLINSREFKIFDPPLILKHPIAPNPKQNIAISVILGLVIGSFVAFFVELWQREAKDTKK